jgi:predicted nuclease of predicted toxin-antitoxin system
MTVAIYIDENVHKAIADELRIRGVDALSVREDDRTGISDLEVLERARELKRVVFTRDQDFLIEANVRSQKGETFAGVVYAHQLSVSIGRCVEDLELIAKVSTYDELCDRVQFLPL